MESLWLHLTEKKQTPRERNNWSMQSNSLVAWEAGETGREPRGQVEGGAGRKISMSTLGVVPAGLCPDIQERSHSGHSPCLLASSC